MQQLLLYPCVPWSAVAFAVVFGSRIGEIACLMSSRRFLVGVLAGLAALGGCRTGINYNAAGPRFAGAPVTSLTSDDRDGPDTLRVASFNIKYSQQIDSAIQVLRSDSALHTADVLLLQEMNADGTRRIAEAMGMSYAYYPATYLTKKQRDFGNAVLSRWPIEADRKILLPHHSRFQKTQRIATAATIVVGDSRVRVYSVHLGTMADVIPGERRAQLRTILADAKPFERVIIGGDMNNHGIGRMVSDSGYAWPTEHGPNTIRLWRWDHIFVRGLALPDTAAAGTVLDVRNASDHRPVWVSAIIGNE
jgi:endonuclease/exonuclease/phosphatase family metal-dependent hydrolase